MDTTELDQAPNQGAFPEASIFFLIYIILGGMFCTNLFIGFVVDGFNANKGATKVEVIFGRYKRQLKKSAPCYDTFKPPLNVLSSVIRIIMQSSPFQTFSTLCVVANVGFMLADNADSAGTEFGQIQDTQNFIFFWELVAENVLSLLAYGPGGFYNDSWRLFDLLVCVGTSIGYVSNSQALISFARIFRLMRVIRLMVKLQQIRIILETLVTTIPQLVNVIILVVLIYSMCAVLGVQLFATTKRGMRLGPTGNFDDFPNALMSIWTIVTGDEWMIFMTDCSVSTPSCTSYAPGKEWGDCGSRLSSTAFFVLVKILCEFIMLNLFIGLILDNFSYITEDVGHEEDDRWSEGPSVAQLNMLCTLFKEYDSATGFMPITSVHCFLCDLPPPLGYRKKDGTLKFTYMDRLLEHLIRSELNLIMRQTQKNQVLKEQSWKRRFERPQTHKLFVQSISYTDFFMTVTYWRLPRILPDLVKFLRQETVQECAYLASALTIVAFFQTLSGRRKRSRIRSLLEKNSVFERWATKDDSHRSRWEDHAYGIKTHQRNQAKQHSIPLGSLLQEPTILHDITLRNFAVAEDDMPKEFLKHSTLVKDILMLKVPQPINSIEMLKQMVSAHLVILRPSDPVRIHHMTTQDHTGNDKVSPTCACCCMLSLDSGPTGIWLVCGLFAVCLSSSLVYSALL